MTYNFRGVVIDNGSGTCKAGFVGQHSPSTIFSTVVGHPRQLERWSERGLKDTYIGNEVINKRDFLTLGYPVERGFITNWDTMEKVWHHTFYNGLRVDPEEYSVLLSEVPLNPKENKEKMAQIMFETFKVPSIFVAMQAVLAMYSTGYTTGVVLDSGHGVSHTVPVFHGFPLNHAIKRLDVGGRDLTEHLMKMLNERGDAFMTESTRKDAIKIKETLTYVALHFTTEMDNSLNDPSLEKQYELPDGQIITLGTERFRCSEGLFNPSLTGVEAPGIQSAMFDSVQKCDVDMRRDMYGNILLSGGSTMFPGFSDRLRVELLEKVPPSLQINIKAPTERNHSVWIGGSVLASLEEFRDMFIAKSEYDETGPCVVHSKCFI
ncbi:actin, clone 302-like [Corticium candelabrum]|uniref:actin, clone 302-like n=1 Tax=Corticium candelabrum TaxID=121492 RepID=UPI002E25DEEC|nr:actin, clone 302-like [Corticium candelabrum]